MDAVKETSALSYDKRSKSNTISTLSYDRRYENGPGFVTLCSNRWLVRIGVTALYRIAFPLCREPTFCGHGAHATPTFLNSELCVALQQTGVWGVILGICQVPFTACRHIWCFLGNQLRKKISLVSRFLFVVLFPRKSKLTQRNTTYFWACFCQQARWPTAGQSIGNIPPRDNSQGAEEFSCSLALLCKPYILTYMKDARIQEGYRRTITSHRRRARAFVRVRVSNKIISTHQLSRACDVVVLRYPSCKSVYSELVRKLLNVRSAFPHLRKEKRPIELLCPLWIIRSRVVGIAVMLD